jgi:hypothetical protein
MTEGFCGASGTRPERKSSAVLPRVGSWRKPGSPSFGKALTMMRWPLNSCWLNVRFDDWVL